RSRKRREPAPRQGQAAPSGTRTCELPAHSLELRYSEVPDNRRPLPARQELGHLLHPRSLYACTLFPCLSPCGEQTREPIVRSMNGCSAVSFSHKQFCALRRWRPCVVIVSG